MLDVKSFHKTLLHEKHNASINKKNEKTKRIKTKEEKEDDDEHYDDDDDDVGTKKSFHLHLSLYSGALFVRHLSREHVCS